MLQYSYNQKEYVELTYFRGHQATTKFGHGSAVSLRDTVFPRYLFTLEFYLLRSRVGSVLIEPRKSPEKITGSDKGFDTDLFADLDKDEVQTEKNWAS